MVNPIALSAVDTVLRGARVLVTGGLGFIGQNLVRRLVQAGCRVTVIDNCENSSPEAMRDIQDRFVFIHRSVLDGDALRFLHLYDYIFHLACVQIAHSATDPGLDLAVNAESTLRILEHLRHTPGRLARFVYTSSASVYGSAQNFPCSETGPTRVLSHYAATKLLGEQYTQLYYNLYGIPTTALRYSNVYGPGQTPANAYCGVIGKFIEHALHGKPLTIHGSGAHTRDYTFVSDAVDATLLSAVAPQSAGQVYNVGTGREASVLEVVQAIDAIQGPLEVCHLAERAIDNISRRSMDIRKIQQELGWSPKVSLREGLQHTFEWCRSTQLAEVAA